MPTAPEDRAKQYDVNAKERNECLKSCCVAVFCCGCCTFLRAYRVMQTLGTICAIIFGTLTVMSILQSVTSNIRVVDQIFTIAEGIYVIVFCLLIIGALFDVEMVIKKFEFLDSWVGLGLFQLFVALLSYFRVRYYSSDAFKDSALDDSATILALEILCYIAMIVGLAFMVFGLAGGKNLRMKKQEEALAAKQAGAKKGIP